MADLDCGQETLRANRQSKVIEILNRQKRHRIKRTPWQEFAEQALQAIGERSKAATIVLVGDAAITKLNRQFRGRNYATDVLSFPADAEPFENADRQSLGEVVISVQRAAAQARPNGLTFDNEVRQLILHGLLHLCGYDHETDNGEMNRLELKLRKRFGIRGK
jgi:probable rRNA maturation factor